MSGRGPNPPVGSNTSSGTAAQPKARTAPTRRSQSRQQAKQAELKTLPPGLQDVASKVIAPWDLPEGSYDWKSEFSFELRVPPQQSAAEAAIAAAAAARRDHGRVSERPRWGRHRTDMQDRSIEKAPMRQNAAARSQSSPSSRPNPLLSGGSPTKPTQDRGRVFHDGFEQLGRPPEPPTSTNLRSPTSPSPSRPNPLLAGLRSPTPTPPRQQAALDNSPFSESPDAALDNSPFPDSPDADIASATSSKKSKRRSTREARSATPAPSASFEPAAFLQSMFNASVPTASSVVPAAVASIFAAAVPAPQEPMRRSTRRSTAGKSQKAATFPPPKRTREGGGEKLPEGARTSASAAPAMAGDTPSSTPMKRSREGAGQGKRTTSRGSLQTSNRIPSTKSPTGTAPPTSFPANGSQARGSASAAAVPPPARSSVNSSESNQSTRTLTPDHLKDEKRFTIEKKVAAWDLTSSAESSPTDSTFASGNKIDRELVSAKPKPRPKQSTRRQAAGGSNSAVQKTRAAPPPPTPSFIDMFGSSRTPSFDNLGGEVEDELLRTAEFGENALLTPRPKAGTWPEQQGSPTKDPNRKARIGGMLSIAVSETSRSCPPSPEKKKVGLASLATRPPVVRFARVQDIAVADKSLLGSKVPAFAQLGLKMYDQRVLSSSWQWDNLDLKALAIWYLPYLMFALCYVFVILLAGQGSESLLISVPLFLCLPALHMARLASSNRSLQRTVDNAALAEFHDQLKSPVGWSTNAVFMATLGGAMQAFQKSFPRLLASPPMHLPMRSAIVVSAALSFLGFVRSMRASGIGMWESVEAVFAVLALTLVVFVGCSPTGLGDRAKEADVRLSVLEAAFNTMLDTLRPLMGDLGGGAARCSEPISPGGALVAFSRFSVRLITSDRNTLRCDLHVLCKDSPKLFVSCPLANFTIHSNSIYGIAPADLGVSAANPAVLASQASSASSPGSGQGLSAVAASMGINLGERRQRRREDDEISISLASASTASTLRSRRGVSGGFQPSEASLKLAMAMVTTISARSNEPLEAFRPTGLGAVLPPKTAVDEPSLLIELAFDSVQTVAEASSDPCHWEPKGQATSTEKEGGRLDGLLASLQGMISLKKTKKESAEAVNTFGVLRNAERMEHLCRVLPQGTSGLTDLSTSSSRPASTPLGRLSSDSDSDEHSVSDDDELRKCHPSAADGYLNQADICSQHLAVVFDTIEERDRCHSLFEIAGLLPDPPPEWP